MFGDRFSEQLFKNFIAAARIASGAVAHKS
jgi:hypothetical protein